MPRVRTVISAFSAVALLSAAPAAQAAPAPFTVDAGDGSRLVLESEPFRMALIESDGTETVATVPGTGGVPVRPPGADGPQPLEPAGSAGAYPALAFVTGARAGITIPVGFFAGNRLFGAESGGISAVTGVRSVAARSDGADLALNLSSGGEPARLEVRRLPGGGVALELRPPPGFPAVSTLFTLDSPAGEGLFGLGGRKDAFDQRGLLRNVWVEQQNAGDERTEPATGADPTGTTGEQYSFPNGRQASYYVQSSLFGSRGWAAWVGGSQLSRLDLASTRRDSVRWGVATPTLSLRLAGGGLERASQAFTAQTGRAPAPPRWVYEPWIDVLNEGEGEAAPNGAGFAGGPRVKSDLDGIVAKLKELDIPVGVLGVEGWHKVLDEEGPQAKAYFRSLREKGFHLSAYWNPFTAAAGRGFAEARDKGLFIRDPSGRPYPIVTNRNNPSNVLDFTRPGIRDFWKRQLDRSADLGFEGFMEDFGEFVTEGMTFADGTPPELAHNAYPVNYHAAGRAAIDAQARERKGFEPWFYVRAGFDGVTRATSGVFPGDETTDWSKGSGLPSVIPAMLNHALGGSYTYTTDVGGYLDLYTPRTTPELLIRWSQLAAFTPVSRIHNSTGKKTLLPWQAGEEAIDAYRRYARAKVRLVDLVDRLSRSAARKGTVGPVRPLVLDDPSPAARAVTDQWLLGRDLLVAPIVVPGATSRRVYLPAGSRWERVTVGRDGTFTPSGEVHAGGRTITAPGPLADIPLFRREVRVALIRRCVGAGRLRVNLGGALASVLRGEVRVGRRVLPALGAGSANTFLTRRQLSRTRARAVRARIVLQDGRIVRLKRRLPRCGLR